MPQKRNQQRVAFARIACKNQKRHNALKNSLLQSKKDPLLGTNYEVQECRQNFNQERLAFVLSMQNKLQNAFQEQSHAK